MSFEQAISTGYATDGGLYVPEQLPRVDSAELEQLAALSFPELAEAIFRKFISAEEVQHLGGTTLAVHHRTIGHCCNWPPSYQPSYHTLQSADSCSARHPLSA